MDQKAAMAAYAQEAGRRGFFNGAYLYAEGGQVVASGVYGTRDAAQTLLVEEDTVFELASVSKQFTAAAVMVLRKQGKLSLDDDVRTYFPRLPYEGRTIRHLLHHTAGLPDYESWVCALAERTHAIPGNECIEEFLCSGQPALFAPGEKWCYSNTGYALLALLVARVSGMPFPAFMQRYLFAPAGMTHTCIYHRRRDGVTIDNYAYGLVLSNGRYVLPDDDPAQSFVIPLDGIEGDGVVNSTAGDLLRWDTALRRGEILSPEEQALLYASGTLNNGRATGYGFGWEVSDDPALRRIVQHAGGWPGYSTNFVRFLDAGRVLVLLTNRAGFDDTARRIFKDGMTALAMGHAPEPLHTLDELVTPRADTSFWTRLCGEYEGGYTVFLREGHLFLRVLVREESTVEMELFPTGERCFGAREIGYCFAFGEESLRMDGKEYPLLRRT